MGVLQVGGPSCSTHKPWPVHPDPRGVGAALTSPGPEPTSDHNLQAPIRSQAGISGVGPEVRASGRAARTPLSRSHRQPVSTALTLANPPRKRPVRIVEIPRFVLGVRRRSGANVSAMDIGESPDLFHRPTIAFGATSHTRNHARVGVSEVEETRRSPVQRSG